MSVPKTLRKTPEEKRTYEFNFTLQPEIVAGATIASVQSLTITPSGPTLGSASISGGRVQFTIEGGTNDVRYFLNIVVILSNGSKLEESGILSVYDDELSSV